MVGDPLQCNELRVKIFLFICATFSFKISSSESNASPSSSLSTFNLLLCRSCYVVTSSLSTEPLEMEHLFSSFYFKSSCLHIFCSIVYSYHWMITGVVLHRKMDVTTLFGLSSCGSTSSYTSRTLGSRAGTCGALGRRR